MEPVWAKEDRCYWQKKDYFIYETFYANLIMVTTKQNLEQRQETKKSKKIKQILIQIEPPHFAKFMIPKFAV